MLRLASLAASLDKFAGGVTFWVVGVAAAADLQVGSRLAEIGEAPMKRLLVDYSLIGQGRTFPLTLLKGEREGLEVGSRVEVVGDSVPPRIAEVTAVSPDEKIFEFAFAY